MSAVAGSLLLNLEGPFTMAIAVLVFREHLGRYGMVAAACILLGAGALRLQPGSFAADAIGILCIAGACLAWGVDNNLTQRLLPDAHHRHRHYARGPMSPPGCATSY